MDGWSSKVRAVMRVVASLAAFDDFEWADLFSPRLTTVAQPCLEIGARAVRLLLSRLADPTRRPLDHVG